MKPAGGSQRIVAIKNFIQNWAAGESGAHQQKNHAELNFIELTWAYMKRVLCYDCTFNYSDMKGKIEHLLRGNIPLSLTRRNARFCYRRFMDGYRIGLQGPVLEYAMRKYKCHRTISAAGVRCLLQRFKRNLMKEKLRKSRMLYCIQ